VPGPTRQDPPEEGRRAVFSDFTNSGYWEPAYQAQDEALDKYMKKYGLENQDWRPGMKKMIKAGQK
jgi:hypothetical protein